MNKLEKYNRESKIKIERQVPKLLVNDYKNKIKLSNEFYLHLKHCKAFYFSVAFIKDSGLAVLKPILLELEQKGVPGYIITSTYLGFNSPKSFRELLKFKNIKVAVYQHDNFHPKGYVFNYGDKASIIVGSANLTQKALTVNTEWNIGMDVDKGDEILEQIYTELRSQWEDSILLSEEWISEYEKNVYQKIVKIQSKTEQKIQPNSMQKSALKSLKQLREQGESKALIISATGTGKTFLSAFDVQTVNPKRMLFIVHRENIARTAMRTFKKVIKDKSVGLFTGTVKDKDYDYLFCTVQTIHKYEYLKSFKSDEFEYIIIDEVHHAGASSYQNIFNYFNPKFLLGMSATPERRDNFDIYKLFDYNIAYEIRLHQAMEYKLLCPFHYYGISDLIINGESIDDKSDFNRLISNARVDHIINNIEKYGYSGDRVKGLVFCSRKDEAKQLSDIFNQRGYRTTALVGENSEESRIRAIDLLESDDPNDCLDYIFTVDIFNEGIDIPSVNQVVMLRPTESHIVFVQQLGRGLRKNSNKEYVIIIDFIGNYEKNFQIPIALSGNLSYNKEYLRRFVLEGSMMLPGESTISFDEISKKRIFENIDRSNFNTVELLKESYFELKNKLGKIPSLMDFERYESIDVLRIIKNPTFKSYHKFLSKYDSKEYTVKFNEIEEKYLEYISMKFADGKRVHELEAIKLCITRRTKLMDFLKQKLKDEYNIELNAFSQDTIINELSQNFATGVGKDTYKDALFIENIKDPSSSQIFNQLIVQNEEFRRQILEVIDFGIYRYKKEYSNRYKDTDFCLYKTYTYEDVCRLLNWETNVVAQNIGGYKYDQKTKTLPVFVNYDKEEGIKDSINYNDHFVNPHTLICMSKSGDGKDSARVKYFKDSEKNNTEIHMFIRKNKDDKKSKEFYYLGKTKVKKIIETVMPKNNKIICEIHHTLDVTVRKDIYDYFAEN